jgi:isochorismate synthase/2-succinyl-5-enolpyruvyl-6-hydroxy-3-cyclohexene-1-carboxylate synthase/2-succinyl-6-hydroxy-2,4-cyclohexadiene-1-carboxylate synthase/O-succinylbenzoate synthase
LGLKIAYCCCPVCAGEGLFVGNSMPIRDLDMYAAPAADGSSSSGSSAALRQGVVATSLGAPVAANRGASGIDGVLSTGVLAAPAVPALLACALQSLLNG